MKIPKALRIVLAISIMSLLVARIAYVNATSLKRITAIHTVGDVVELDGSFTDTATENTKGYSVTVESAELLSYEDFMNRFDRPLDYLSENSRKSTVLLKLKYVNQGNETGGVSTSRLFLFNNSFSQYFAFDSDYFSIANPQIDRKVQGIRIRPGTEYVIYYPYILEYGPELKSYLDILQPHTTESFYLQVSMYPVKNLIKVDVQI